MVDREGNKKYTRLEAGDLMIEWRIFTKLLPSLSLTSRP